MGKRLDNMIALRKDAGLTQDQLAEKVNLSRATINLIERGHVWTSYENLKKIADTLGTTPDKLII